jgi:hypothetical protein
LNNGTILPLIGSIAADRSLLEALQVGQAQARFGKVRVPPAAAGMTWSHSNAA